MTWFNDERYFNIFAFSMRVKLNSNFYKILKKYEHTSATTPVFLLKNKNITNPYLVQQQSLCLSKYMHQ